MLKGIMCIVYLQYNVRFIMLLNYLSFLELWASKYRRVPHPAASIGAAIARLRLCLPPSGEGTNHMIIYCKIIGTMVADLVCIHFVLLLLCAA